MSRNSLREPAGIEPPLSVVLFGAWLAAAGASAISGLRRRRRLAGAGAIVVDTVAVLDMVAVVEIVTGSLELTAGAAGIAVGVVCVELTSGWALVEEVMLRLFGLLISSSVFASGTSCRKTLTVTLLASGVVLGAGVVDTFAGSLTSGGALELFEDTLGAGSSVIGAELGPAVVSSETGASVDEGPLSVVAWSATGERLCCSVTLTAPECWCSPGCCCSMSMVSLPDGSIRLLNVISWS